MGSPIAVLAEEGDDISAAASFTEKASSPAAEQPTPKNEVRVPPPSSPTPSKSTASNILPVGPRIFASPIAKKIALERGIPLAHITGTGPEGRIIKKDVESYQPRAAAAHAAPSPAVAETASADYVDTPISSMRRTIGNRLTQSKQELPHYYVTVDISMDKVLKLREVFNKTLAEKENAAKLSVNDFIIKAVACALSDVPEVNSAWLGEVIRT